MHSLLQIMKTFKILTLLAIAAGSITLTSCGCHTGEEEVPPLRPLPNFKPIVPSGPVVPAVIEYAK